LPLPQATDVSWETLPGKERNFLLGGFWTGVNKVGGLTLVLQPVLKVTENACLTYLTRPMEDNDPLAIDEFIDLIHNSSFENSIHFPPNFVLFL
jgi:hypothetical protein